MIKDKKVIGILVSGKVYKFREYVFSNLRKRKKDLGIFSLCELCNKFNLCTNINVPGYKSLFDFCRDVDSKTFKSKCRKYHIPIEYEKKEIFNRE